MRKNYLILGCILFLVLNLPPSLVVSLRAGAAYFLSVFAWAHTSRIDEVEHLRLENRLLRNEIASLTALQGQFAQLRPSTFAAARVIYRGPTTWSSSFWVDVGESTNAALGCTVVAKNSPVVVGTSVVGVVDYVEQEVSCVRLITDSGLHPAVRVLREEACLAKGELHGSSAPLWRTFGDVLTGIGFNYDFPDEKGGARDLRTGHLLSDIAAPAEPLVKVGDLLVTTGMDGVFPPNLEVATVIEVGVLREGSYAFELKAVPTAENIHSLENVLILPPQPSLNKR